MLAECDALMAIPGRVEFQIDPQAARNFRRELEQSEQQMLWLPCSKLRAGFRFFPEKWLHVAVYQDQLIDPFLKNVAALLNHVLLPAVRQGLAVSFFSRLPQTAYAAQLGSDGLHGHMDHLYQQLFLEQLFAFLPSPGQTTAAPANGPAVQQPTDPDLDEKQWAAIRHLYGPIRVLAPAGSGKTKTLINRIIHLVHQGIAGQNILALAFNKKAAQEMVERLSGRGIVVAPTLEEPGVTVRTFHSLGYEIIRRQLGWRYRADDGEQACRDLLRRAAEAVLKLPALRNQDPITGLLSSLRKSRTDLPGWEEMATEINGEVFPFKDIFRRYLQLQSQRQFLDFDDMVYWALRLLLDQAELRKKMQQRFQFVLIDEFQDLNRSQLLLMQLLSLPHNNLFVVGDDDQMIYGWRGADVQNILNFADYYGGAKTLTLETNYRSTKQIIRHSGWLIQNNRRRVAKNIQSTPHAQSGEFSVALQDSLWAQAKQAVEWMQRTQKEQQVDWHRCAILYRYHVYRYVPAMLLDSYHIPHTRVDGAGLLQTAVGRDLYAYLSVLFFPDQAQEQEFHRVLKRPNKFLTNAVIRTIASWPDLQRAARNVGVSERERLILQQWLQTAQQARRISVETMPAREVLRKLSALFELDLFYANQRSSLKAEDEAGQEIVLAVMLEVATASATTADFYQQLHHSLQNPLPAEGRQAKEETGVTLATIHACKGREFSHVVLFNMADNIHVASNEELEEERRVAYVGATRAIRSLLVTAPHDQYSDFLTEAALNPALAYLSWSMLHKGIVEARKTLQKWQQEEQVLGKRTSRKAHLGCTDIGSLQEKLDELVEEQNIRRLFLQKGQIR
jgi:DNA helicase II / ATP-dependent DNA helicase PcrA